MNIRQKGRKIKKGDKEKKLNRIKNENREKKQQKRKPRGCYLCREEGGAAPQLLTSFQLIAL